MHNLLLHRANNSLNFILHLCFPTVKSDKENSKDCSQQDQDFSHPSPVKQTKSEVEGQIHDLKDKDKIKKRRSSLSLGTHEGMFNAMKVA